MVCSHSSDEGEVAVKRCAVSSVRSEGGRGRGGEWSEDEFERDMESELMGLLQTVASPDTLMAISSQGQQLIMLTLSPHCVTDAKHT